MKKTKRFFSLILIALICFSPCFFSPLTSAKAQTVADINANLSVSGWVDEKELTDTYLKVGEGVIPTGVNYHATFGDHEYLKEYILINGKSVKEINEDSTLGASEWNYTVFPATADVKYKIPVVLFASGDYVQIKMHDNYVALLGDKVEITAKAGLYFVNNGVRYENSADKTFTAWEKPVVTDFTQNLSTSGWIDQSELKVTYLRVGTGVMPSSIDYGMLDRAEYKYVQEYILINGKSVKEINEDQTLGAKDWTYTVFPSSKDDKYKVPIILFAQADRIEIKIHSEYLALLGDKVEITAKAGLYFVNNGKRYENSADKTFTAWEKPVVTDFTQNLSTSGWIDQSELKVTYLCVGTGVMPSGIDYGMLDRAEYKYVQEYILINGKSVKEINEDQTLGAKDWTYTVFPSSKDDKYKVPIILFAQADRIEIKIHPEYLALLGDRVEITAKVGLYFENNGVRYENSTDKTFTVWEQEQIDIVDTTENVWVKTWSTTGDAGELTYARINLGDGVFPSGVEYKVSDGEWQYIQEYVLINGTSVKDINANTDVSSYVFSTFPSSVDDKYKLPIIIFVNNGVMELKIHNSFLLALGDDLEITIKSGLFVLNGKVKYTVEKDVCYVLSGDIWSDKNKLYTITYYVNGKEYAKDEVSYNSALNLCDEPQVESGYFFSGWEYSSTPSVIQDMEIHGYIRPVRYSITYHLNGGKNSPQNPIVYYVTDGEIILKDAVKEGAVFKGWYTSNDYAQRVEKLTTDKLGSVELYALFEEEPSSGCASSILGGDVAVVLMGVAITLIGIKGFKKAQSKKEPLPKNIR